jgi:hypothetical protein
VVVDALCQVGGDLVCASRARLAGGLGRDAAVPERLAAQIRTISEADAPLFARELAGFAALLGP